MNNDLISRSDIKTHISELMLVYSGEELDNAILNAIDNAPTVIIDEWISVDATLPKYTGLYLVSIDSLVTVANFDGTVFRSKGTSAPMGVDAWQPLPKSYKEVEGE
jgi:hypothetical protein